MRHLQVWKRRGAELPKRFITLTNSPLQENQRAGDLITSHLLPYLQIRKQQQQHATVVGVTRGCKVTGSSEYPGSFYRAIAKGFLVAISYRN